MFRSWLISGFIISGIAFVVLGIYTLKSDPNSWVRSSTTWIEFPEWFTFVYTGIFFIVMGIIALWLT